MKAPKLMVHGFADSAHLAARLAALMRVKYAPVRQHSFPDGESLVRVEPSAGNSAILVRSFFDPNTKLIEVMLAADALRRAGARRVTLVAPYLPYMRQDKVFEAGEPVSQRVVADLLGRSFDRVLTIAPHLHRIRSLKEIFQCPARALSAAPAIAGWLRRNSDANLVVGPDEESAPMVRTVARLARTHWTVGKKERLGDRMVHIRFAQLPAASFRAILVDDIASSGATLAAAARALRAAGGILKGAAVVHPIFGRGALACMRGAGIPRIVSCDTLTHPTNAIPVAPLIAQALRHRL
jgi:ribose-phosphate pyrophosphokinase